MTRWIVYDNGQQVKPAGNAPDGSIANADLATVGLQDTIKATGSINDAALPWGDGSITAVRRGGSVTITEEDAPGQSVNGSSTPGKDNTLSVQPGLAYTLSESGSVDGYEQTGLTAAAAIAALALITAGATGLVLRRRRSGNSR